MKATLRIPCKQQYAYIEAEIEGTSLEIVERYFELSDCYWWKQKEKDEKLPFKDDHCGSKESLSKSDYLNSKGEIK